MGDTYWAEWIMQPMGVAASVNKTRDGKISENRDYWNGAAPSPRRSKAEHND
jgi:hypothetical protein